MVAANREPASSLSRSAILDEIRKAGQISRVEIAERTGQSRSLVTNITADLIREGLIIEKETIVSKSRGRRRVLLGLNPDAVYVAGVKVSALQVSFAVTDFQAGVKSSLVVPVRTGERPVEFLADVIEEGLRHCAKAARLNMSAISGIGIGIPGFIDSATGICHWTPLYENCETSLRDLFRDRFDIPAYIENDANAVTVAEQWFGLGKGVDDFIVVTIEEGVGMGIVLGGRLFTGVRGIAAEFGHMVIDPEGPPCRCGKRGCIEAYASGGGIMRAVRQAHAEGKWPCADITQLTMPDVIDLAHGGDAVLRRIFRKAGEVLGLGVAGLLQIFNPAKMIFTGEYANSGDLLFNPMRKTIKKLVHKEYLVNTELNVQPWVDTDWARGAASLALQEIYKSPLEIMRSLKENNPAPNKKKSAA